jgi:uncharacterized protein (DUF4415 family)
MGAVIAIRLGRTKEPTNANTPSVSKPQHWSLTIRARYLAWNEKSKGIALANDRHGERFSLCCWLCTQVWSRTMKKSSGSSQREKQRRGSAASTRKASRDARRNYEARHRLTAQQQRELATIAALPDDQIDTSDIPELPPGAWKNAVRGKFYRPLKQPISLRLDADVIAWLKRPGKGYQTRANRLLRERMLAEMSRS